MPVDERERDRQGSKGIGARGKTPAQCDGGEREAHGDDGEERGATAVAEVRPRDRGERQRRRREQRRADPQQHAAYAIHGPLRAGAGRRDTIQRHRRRRRGCAAARRPAPLGELGPQCLPLRRRLRDHAIEVADAPEEIMERRRFRAPLVEPAPGTERLARGSRGAGRAGRFGDVVHGMLPPSE